MSRVDGVSRTTRAVVAVAVVALALRLVGLGERPFHWDEARVGVWALHFVRTGAFEYRPVAGGPLPYHLARATLGLLGATDFAARLPVALVGGLLPLSALGLRGRLDEAETVLSAVVLACSPPLVYYGRVLRGDLLLAAAAFVASVLALRVLDGDRRAAYGVAVCAALALAASGFVVAVVACVGAAAAVAVDPRRLSSSTLAASVGWLRARPGLVGRCALVFLVVVVFFFAPRGGDGGLWSLRSAPSALGFVLTEAPARFVAVRVGSRYADGVTHPLLPFVASLGSTLVAAALPTVALGLSGALAERYRPASRPVVLFFAIWAGLAVVVVPTVAEVDAPWLAVYVVVPLAVPAAVGAAHACAVVRDAVARDDAAIVAGALLAVVAVVAQVGGVLAGDVYARPTPQSDLAGYAQPADDLQPFAANVSTAGATTDEPTVLYYGDRFHTGQWREADGPPVPERWGSRLPLPWYVTQHGKNATSLPSTAALPPDPPPVVVTDPTNARAVQSQLRGYERGRYRLALWNREVVVFVRGV